MHFCPNVFTQCPDGVSPTPYLVSDGNDHEKEIISLAIDFGIPLFGGSVAFRSGNKIFNRAYNILSNGEVLSTYDKINLFACDFFQNGKKVKEIRESNIYTPGNELNIFKYKEMKIGNAICFDLRFPGIFQQFINEGVDLITIPSAFTKKNGRAALAHP